MKDVWITAIAGIAGTFIGAFIPSLVQLLNIRFSRKDKIKEKYEEFTRSILDEYIPLTRILVSQLKDMDYKGEIDFNRNKLIGEMIIGAMKRPRDILANKLIKIYPLELRDDISDLYLIDINLFFYTHFIMNKDRYEVMSKRRNLSTEISNFIVLTEKKLNELEKKIIQNYI